MKSNNVPFIPLPASGASSTTAYTSTDGYWLPTTSQAALPGQTNFFPIVKGFIKIEAQLAPYPAACSSADQQDVTVEVLALGYIGRNINPVTQSLDGVTMNPGWQYVAGNP